MSPPQRVTVDRDICHGKPCVRHMRWPVAAVLDLLSAGMSPAEIQADHPELEPEDWTPASNTLGLRCPVTGM